MSGNLHQLVLLTGCPTHVPCGDTISKRGLRSRPLATFYRSTKSMQENDFAFFRTTFFDRRLINVHMKLWFLAGRFFLRLPVFFQSTFTRFLMRTPNIHIQTDAGTHALSRLLCCVFVFGHEDRVDSVWPQGRAVLTVESQIDGEDPRGRPADLTVWS